MMRKRLEELLEKATLCQIYLILRMAEQIVT